jgi:hypothetical protein
LDGAGEPLGEGGAVTTIRAVTDDELRELVEKFTLAVEGALG